MKTWEALDDDERQSLIEEAKTKPPLQPSAEQCDRLTAQFAIRHESCGQDATSVGATFSMLLKHKEQPYKRTGIKVGQQPVPLDLGWLESVGYIVIENKSQLPRNASKEQKEAYAKHRVLLHISDIPIFVIAPGHAFIVELINKETKDYISFSASDSALINVTAFPC